MPHRRIDPSDIRARPLAERKNLLAIEQIALRPGADVAAEPAVETAVSALAQRVRDARRRGASVMLTYGAHLVKNGCGPLVIDLIRRGWFTHLATQGAGIIHDWEFAWCGQSSESVRDNAATGAFGTWDETGRTIIEAAKRGAESDRGLGEALGKLMIERAEQHPYRDDSITHAAAEHGVPLCVMPGVGYDIYCCHPDYSEDAGAAIGRCAARDFHCFCAGVENLTGGVYLSVGSAIMSPQVFEKAYSIANNLRAGRGEAYLHDHHIAVVDIQDGGGWDWSQGEPPADHPAYYLRFCKSFYRMTETPSGRGEVSYIQADNRVVLAGLVSRLGLRS